MQLVIVTGLSGAGKSNALNCLEDMGYYCIDNMPPSLLPDFCDLMKHNTLDVEKAAVCIDVRAGRQYSQLAEQLDRLRGIELRILFLEASDAVLIRRYNETRRHHPLSETSVKEGLAREREILDGIRSRADNVIDTSRMKAAGLKKTLTDIMIGQDKKVFVVNVSSFGYKHGMVTEADMVFDMRFIPNPYYVPSLKELTGNSKKVRDFVLKQQVTKDFLDGILHIVEEIIPHFVKEGKYNLNIACGCTGGHHRSVVCANEIARVLREKGYEVTLSHRDL